MQRRRWLGALLLPLVLAGCLTRPAPIVAPAPSVSATPPPTSLGALPAGVGRQLEAITDPEQLVAVDLMALTPEHVRQVEELVLQLGGQLVETELQGRHLRAELPAGALELLAQEAPVSAVGLNHTVSVELGEGARIAAPTGQPGPDVTAPDVSHNHAAMRLAQFQQSQPASGAGVRIAVVDTGVDPVHPALQRTAQGQPKLIDWKDFTTEGVVKTDIPVTTERFIAVGQEWHVGAVPSASGRYWFGMWEEFRVYGEIGRDLDRNGSNTDSWGVLVTDSTVPGLYDTVYVDRNGNRSFADEEPIRVFRLSQDTFKLGTAGVRDRRVGFVVADIGMDGKSVTFGFDGHGHGTQVAGIAVAADTGVAPGAQVMALKALRSDGSGEWFHIQNAILYAAQNGAHIINLSIQDLVRAARFDSTASEWLNEVARTYGVLIVVAAGNSGPGLSSGATLGDTSEVLAVGAYYSPDIWARDWGYRLPTEGIWSRTGMGPRSDGTVVPGLVAPGSVATTTPFWRSVAGYRTEEGTSIAAPHVSGAAALLMEGAKQMGKMGDYKSVKRALEMGARSIPGYQIIEQGHGLIQMDAAWEHLRRVDSDSQVRAFGQDGGSGLLARSFVPGSAEFRIENLGALDTRIGLVSLADWVQVGRQSLLVPAGGSRVLPVSYQPPSAYGLHSAFIVLREFDQYGPDIWIPTTYVSPKPLNRQNNYQDRAEGTLQPARYQRHFYEVQPGTNLLNVRVLVPGAPQPSGRVQFFVFRPDGEEVYRSPILGVGGDGISSLAQIPTPLVGTWEVVVTALPDVVKHRPDNPVSRYVMETDATSIPVSPWPLRFVLEPGVEATVPLRFSNQASPFTGQVTAAGLVRAARDQTLDWDVKRKLARIDTFDLAFFTSLLKLDTAGADLKMELWRDGALVAQGRQGLDVRNLPVGRYHVIVESDTPLPDPRFQYRRFVSVDNAQLQVVDSPTLRGKGDSWTVSMLIRTPTQPGLYHGNVILTDTATGRVILYYPLEIEVGLPKLQVSALTSALTPGVAGSVALEVREEATGKLVDVPITVAGRRYQTRGGRIVVPVLPAGDRLNLSVAIEAPGYAAFHTTLQFHVASHWLGLPIGIDSPDLSEGQQRLIDLMQ